MVVGYVPNSVVNGSKRYVYGRIAPNCFLEWSVQSTALQEYIHVHGLSTALPTFSSFLIFDSLTV